MQVSTGPLLNTENKESSENRRTERQENEKSVWTGRGQSSFISVHNENYSEYALRHRDIPKRYILTFLKRDGHVRTHHLRIDPTFKTSR